MQINWFTVIAQVLNFLLLVWLLKRFLYKPILKAFADREEKIASQIKDAESKDAISKKEQAEFSKKNETFDKERKGLMEKVVSETNEEKEKLLEVARKDAVELRFKLEKAFYEMQENKKSELMQKTQYEVFEIARKTIVDLTSVSLGEQSAITFIKRLKELDGEGKEQFLDAFKSSSNPILVNSAFDLSLKQQTEIASAVNEIIDSEIQLQFKTAPRLISGIEISSNGYKLSWSILEYLNSLQKSISKTREEARKAEPNMK
jgi:F-type H+-transporting ATPase subunit b